MERNGLSRMWASVEADLCRAHSLLGESASNDRALRLFGEFLQHNELELACDALGDYGEKHAVSRGFWLALRDAANKMQLPRKADEYEKCSK